MLMIEVGQTYVADKAGSGTNANGPYEFIVIKETETKAKVKKEFKIWVKTPKGISTGQTFRVDSILYVKHSKRKYQENWYDELTISAEITPLMQYAQSTSSRNAGFTTMTDNDEPLPF